MIPQQIKPTFDILSSDLFTLFERIKLYEDLFESGEENHRLFRDHAIFVFHHLQRAITESFIVTISRLTDPKEQARGGENKNLTFDFIIDTSEQLPNSLKAQGLKDKYEKLLKLSEHIRFLRNKIAVHRDRPTSLGLTSLQGNGFTLSDLKNIAESMADILNTISSRFGVSPTLYNHHHSEQECDTLIKALKLLDKEDKG